jgi:ankyrin repeat protein/L-ascorbate metabolism protein UlaG (beta-lactamase superfamily)
MTSRIRTIGPLALVSLTILALTTPASAGEIHRAIAAGDADRVASLLAEDPGLVHSPDENATRDLPLHTAVFLGDPEMARRLLDAGAEVDGFDIDESTPLQVAAMTQNHAMIDLFLERGADVNRRDKNGACALSFAAFSGNAETVRKILEAGADLNYLSNSGITLLHAACYRGLDELFDRLIEQGRSVEEASLNGSTPIHWATAGGRTEMVKRLIAMGAEVAVPDTSGWTPLMKVARTDRVEIAEMLLAHGADPNVGTAEGLCPLVPSVWGGNPAMVSTLVEHGADANPADETGRTPLWWATQDGDPEIVESLLRAGADPNVTEKESGRTPLHNATRAGYGEVVALLLANGANPDVMDAAGRRPIHLATRYGHHAIEKRLVAAGARPADVERSPEPAPAGTLGRGEALVWYVGHSGWAVQTRDHFLLFDVTPRERPADEASLVNGNVVPAELSGLNVAAFASHVHGDHFDPAIFDWRSELDDPTYVLGFHPAPGTFEGEPPAYEYVDPGEPREIDGLRIRTIESNDSGVGFVVEVDGLVIFHPGDHANRVRETLEGYRDQIDAIAAAGLRPDICFQPISGCNFGDLVAVDQGVEYTLATLKPRLFFPMHGGSQEQRYRAYVAEHEARFPDVRMHAAEAPGDCVRYSVEEAS